MKKYIFSDQEKSAIESAVKELEKESCGEIVPVYISKSDDYEEVQWKMGALFGLVGLFAQAILSYLWLLPSISILTLSITVASLMVLGFFLPILFPAVVRLFSSEERMMANVTLKAKEAFLEEKVFETNERIGILIFISKLEHLVLVVGDEGINQKVQPDDWQRVVSLVIGGIKSRQIGNGLVDAIHCCKDLLLSHGFVRKDSDFNELSDGLRIQD